MVRLGMSDRFLLRRATSASNLFQVYDTFNHKSVGDGKGNVLLGTEKEMADIKREMTARVALLRCDENTRKLAFA